LTISIQVIRTALDPTNAADSRAIICVFDFGGGQGVESKLLAIELVSPVLDFIISPQEALVGANEISTFMVTFSHNDSSTGHASNITLTVRSYMLVAH